MNSPANTNFLHLIQLDKNSSTPIYLQLSQQIINSIQRGVLNAGNRLPGTRMIANSLQLNRNTIVSVFDELQAQGWIEIIPNKGTFVLKQFDNPIIKKPYKTSIAIEKYPATTGYSVSQSYTLDYVPTDYNTTYFLTDGTADLRLNRFKQLSYQYTASMNRKSTLRNLARFNDFGRLFFKEQLSNFLNQTRGLHISKDNILINRSSEMSIYLLSRIMIKENDKVVVAEWSNPTINMTFANAGAKMVTIPLDDEGIQIDQLHEYVKKHPIRLVYITPHHHYPTTVTLSAARRINLLQLAQKHNFIIIEDDYDYDFHYEKTAVLPIITADTTGMVIYTGTFGKSLAPSFQTSFIVAPENLIIELNKYQRMLDRQGDNIMEQALGEMIEEGNIHRHIKKSIKVYRSRRDTMCNQLDLHFGNSITYKKPTGGLAVWVEFNSSVPLYKIAEVSKKHNLTIPKEILFQNKKTTAIRIGFGHLNDEEIIKTIQILKQCVDEVSTK